MAALTLTGTGLLPEGVHDATLDEIESAFGSINDRRRDLFGKLTSFVNRIRPTGLFERIFIDGSFVTDKPAPGDIDAALEVKRGVTAAQTSTCAFVFDMFAVKKEYELHLFVGPAGNPIVPFFQTMRAAETLLRKVAPDQKRGIVQVIL